jgi:membrane protein implicated in regulation of membrane protease activity
VISVLGRHEVPKLLTSGAEPVRPSFFPQTFREWRMVGAILLFGAVAILLLPRIFGQLSKTELAILMALFLVAEPWFHERGGPRPNKHGAHTLLRGRMGIVTATFCPQGRVTVDGTSWAARSLDARPLEPGEAVHVHDAEGFLLLVSREEPKAD